MPLVTEDGYYLEDFVPDVLGAARQVLTRHDATASEHDVQEWARTVLHEAAHLYAASYCRASADEVRIATPGRARRTGVCGGVQCAERWSDDAAFVHLVGYAWEELHGDVIQARNDWAAGQQEAQDAEVPFDDLLEEARKFARVADLVIRHIAVDLLEALPKNGVIAGRALRKIYDPLLSGARVHGRVSALSK